MQYLIIRGNIGAGKSTVATLVAEMLEATLVLEPVDEWRRSGALEAMYKGAKVPFQSYALATRVAKVAFSTLGAQTDVTVLDRWIDDDLLFATINLKGTDFAEYTKLWQQVSSMNHLVDTFTVWLDTDVKTCMERIMKRGRPEEECITEEYLNLLVAAGGSDAVVTNTNRSPHETATEIVNLFRVWRSST